MNKTVLITGTSRGIGYITAKLFAENGWNVVATMRNTDSKNNLNNYKNIFVTTLDITQPETIAQSINQGIERFGKIDVLINNAAFGQFGLFEATTVKQIEEQFQVNVFGTMHVTQAILPHFRKNKQGTIINISSAAGRIGMPMVSLYSSSKFAIEGFSESLYYELISQNIKVKLIEPGGVDTTFHKTAEEKFAFNEDLADYNNFTQKFLQKFEKMHDGIATPEQVANLIYNAAIDDTDNLRYIVGNDATTWIGARTTLKEFDYIAYMKNLYEV
ncbi:SDR family oxidoreductase [Sphingobacterium sp. SRCM116780]|uniref:SDR family oxidoreductase n=1 Tax=Sphingobacterium sp. SRCM116780 TaxID=2907623 RepID=UPI001F438E91|nr:SDR family oxidoreductase [Sphingobacterium sp. SRCM116780]UIR56769.1 SDR family oxidoreductase [Sphingobacterium sp. SRCM116780]